ncbi:MAG: tetratricopeptide repeat protein [Pirellulaceae bacterium]
MLRFLIIHVRNARRQAVRADSANSGVESSVGCERATDACPPEPLVAPVTAGSLPAWPHRAEKRSDASRFPPNILPLLLGIVWVAGPGCACFPREAQEARIVAGRQLSLRGIDAQQCGKWGEAETLFAEALKQNPADERAHCHYAEVLWRQGQTDPAIQHQEESVRLSGGDPTLLVQLGQMYAGQGNLAAAWECAEEAVAANRHLAAAWALRGEVLHRQQRWDAALENYHRALSEQPQYPEVQLAVAAVYRMQNQPRRALATLESLESQLRPHAPPPAICFEQGLAYKALGRYQDAVVALTNAADPASPSADLLFELGEAQWLAGNAASAKLALDAALRVAPDHLASRQLHDRIYRQNQTLTAAVKR